MLASAVMIASTHVNLNPFDFHRWVAGIRLKYAYLQYNKAFDKLRIDAKKGDTISAQTGCGLRGLGTARACRGRRTDPRRFSRWCWCRLFTNSSTHAVRSVDEDSKNYRSDIAPCWHDDGPVRMRAQRKVALDCASSGGGVAMPQRGTITRSLTLPGDLVGYYQSPRYAKVTGYLKTISDDKGDWVKAGQFILFRPPN